MKPNSSWMYGVKSTNDNLTILSCLRTTLSLLRNPIASFLPLLVTSLFLIKDMSQLIDLRTIIQFQIKLRLSSIMRKKNVNGYSQPMLNKYSLLKQDSYANDNELENSKVAPITHLPSVEAGLSRNQISTQSSAGKLAYYSENMDRKQRLGEEINKMEDWMTEVYNQKRQQRSFKKTDNLNISTVSIGNDSAILKLPLLNTPPSSSEQTKLMQQIRRVENRIKELKFQRSLASTQQQKYETIRPFMELQSQNMMNMQYMMMMAQQNNSQNHNCCPRNNGNEEQKVVYLPFPQNGPYPQQYPPYPQQYPQQFQQFPPSQFQPDQQANNTANKKSTSKKTQNFKKINKFRVAVIAVSFMLLLPRFANRFAKRRFQLHSEKYFGKDHHYDTLIDLATHHFSEINYYQIAKEVQSTRKEKEIRRVTKSKTAKLIISEEYGDVKNYEIYLGDLEIFLLILLKEIQKLMEDGEMEALLRQIGIGNLPFSFPLDHYYLEQEMFRMKLHPHKMYLQIQQIQSKALLMVCFFVKLLVYDFLFVIREDLEWKHRLLKLNNLKKSQMIEAEMVATQMYISGILLHRYCMDILREGLKETQGNMDKLKMQCIPVPMGMMIYQSKDQVDNDKNLAKSQGKGSRKNSKQENKAPEEVIDFKLYEFKYIKKLAEFQGLMSEIIQKSGHQDEVKEKISDLVDEIHKRAQASRRQEYKEITISLLSDEKKILANRKGLEKNQFQMPKRNNSDSIEIKQFLKQMKEEKGKEQEEVPQPKKKSLKNVKSVKYVDNKTKHK